MKTPDTASLAAHIRFGRGDAEVLRRGFLFSELSQNFIVVRAPRTVAFPRGFLPAAFGKSAPGCQMY